MPRVPHARLVAVCLGVWALSAVACATTTAPQREAFPVYGAPRATESFEVALAFVASEDRIFNIDGSKF
jgi:hypothetical protein